MFGSGKFPQKREKSLRDLKILLKFTLRIAIPYKGPWSWDSEWTQVSLTGPVLTASAPLFIFQPPLLSAAEPVGLSEARGEAGRRFSQGLVNSWLGCSEDVPSIRFPLCLKKKTNTKADFRFTLGFKIYYVFQLSSLHTWNSLLLITFYQHSSTTGGLTSKIALDD